MAAASIKVKGGKELEAAFVELRREVLTELRPALRVLAEPVRALAASKAAGDIPNIGSAWPQMRVGVLLKGVYVAPKQRRRGGSPRRNLAPLLMDRAMQPALDESQAPILAKLDVLVDGWSKRAGF